jgi:hypothetical protein
MAERSTLQQKYAYEIEIDDGTDYLHFYYTNNIDTENPSFLRFDPLYELGHEIEGALSGQTVMIPYVRVMKVIKQKESE